MNVHQLLARWPALVGPVNAEHSQPVGYADTVLTVRAESSTWATSLRTIAPQLVAVLNEQLGQGTVSSLAALLGYPTIVEPNLTLSEQSRAWSWGYGVLVVLLVACAAARLRP